MMTKRGRGQPKWIPDAEILKKVEALAGQGLTKENIANCLGISYQTLNERSKEYADFSDALKRGKAKGLAEVTDALLKNVKLGNVTAQIFYLKCQGKWKEEREEEKTQAEKDAMDIIKELANKCLQHPKK